MTKAISILGCTGSIGRQSIAAAEHLGLPVAAMTVNKKADKAEEYARRLKPRFVAAYDEEAAKDYMESLLKTEGWRDLDCVKDGNYYFLPKDYFHYKPNAHWADAYEYLADIIYPELKK